MRLIVGAPVANRAWILPRWFACLARQTRRPDGVLLIHSGAWHDATWNVAEREARRHGFPLALHHDRTPPHPRDDQRRFATLAALRNRLLTEAQDLDADLFLSLDTDVLLEDRNTVRRLERLVLEDGWDLAQPVTFLHYHAPRAWTPGEPVCWAYSFGWISEHADHPRLTLRRPHVSEIAWGEQIQIDIPMACWLGNRKIIDCRYTPHQSGEDVGFGESLKRAGARCVVDSGLYAPHIWDETFLQREGAAA